MRQLEYSCRYPENRKIAKDVQAIYDGLVLIIKAGHYITAITAYQGETIIITVLDRMIVCVAK